MNEVFKNLKFIRVDYVDYGGIIRSKAIEPSDLEDVIKLGLSVPAAMMNFTTLNTLSVTKMEGYEDVMLFPDQGSLTIYDDQAIMIGDFYTKEGKPWEYDPRQELKKVLNKTDYQFKTSFEIEFYLLKDGKTIGDSSCYELKGYYDVMKLLAEVKDVLKSNGIDVIKSIKECGPSQYEFNLLPKNPLRTADEFIIFKEVSKLVSRKYGFEANFMPKPFPEVAGSGLHLNFSIWKEGKNITLEEEGMNFLAGVLHHAKALTLISAPTINSYKRLNAFKRKIRVPGTWVPTKIIYGYNNRSSIIRIPQARSKDEERFEFRLPDPSVNPYLLLLAFIIAGLDGISRQMHPPNPVNEDVFFDDKFDSVPLTFEEALREFESSRLRELLGKVGDQFLSVKKQELEDSLQDVTDWEWKVYRDI
ncbi:glutamine synthetase family protein [Acidianus ambivalens]|uniref:Glutamine synthetase n=1 Tax=Acidianus ambivalens TaxID=2283 RepID=A0A650CX13_ACIAM|nr:glutamine synthetase family protein [Acidianus ambivalens]MQL54403.1 glutamine synthetase [Acidianus ambivalens]QGR22225.1 glutamine synthetase [Acidianus ambivalens]